MSGSVRWYRYHSVRSNDKMPELPIKKNYTGYQLLFLVDDLHLRKKITKLYVFFEDMRSRKKNKDIKLNDLAL